MSDFTVSEFLRCLIRRSLQQQRPQPVFLMDITEVREEKILTKTLWGFAGRITAFSKHVGEDSGIIGNVQSVQ